MFSRVFVVLAAILLPDVLAQEHGRVVRSDDPTPLEAVVDAQAQTIQQLKTQNQELMTRMAAVEARLTKQEKEVGFNARFENLASVTLVSGQNIVFDHVDFNMGNGYDPATGMFTAPVSGLYLFGIHITHTPPGNLHVWMLKNNVMIAEAEASGDDSYKDRSSNTVVTHMTAGQRVWNKREEGNASNMEGNFRSSFTGVLIRPDHA